MSTPWDDTPRLWHPEPLSGDRRVRVAVIGGGLGGLFLAYHLLRRGVGPIALLEAGELGSGASGRSGGMILDGTSAGPLPGSVGALDGLVATVRREGIECELETAGAWELSRRGSSIGNLRWRDAGILRPVHAVPGGLVHPRKLLWGVARAATRLGADLFEGSPAVALVGSRVLTPRGSVTADERVFASNSFSLSMSGAARGVAGFHTYALATEPLDSNALGIGSRGFYTLDLPYLWGRPLRGGGLLVGGGLSFIPGEPTETPEDPGFFTRLERRIRGLHPALTDARIAHRWAGPIALTRDRTPRLLRLGENWFLGAYAGQGLTVTHLLAERLAAHLAGDASALAAIPWATSPFPPLGSRILRRTWAAWFLARLRLRILRV